MHHHRHNTGYFHFEVPFGGPPFPRGPKARRGDVRTAALLLLAKRPHNGYQIMQAIEKHSEGVWRPSPGAVYPALQQLEDEGLVSVTEADGGKTYELTDAGREYVDERGDDVPPPWEEMTGGVSEEAFEARSLMHEVALALMQVMRAGTPDQIAAATKLVRQTRRSLYRILAEEDEA